MGISVGDYYLNSLHSTSSSTRAEKLQTSLSGLDGAKAADDEMLASCKEFEGYLVEQMLKGMEKTIPKDEEEKENSYLTQFGDMLYQEAGKKIADSGELGLAQQLYEAMKNNQSLS